MSRELTAKQLRFAQLLFEGKSQREAYLQAGYSTKAQPQTIDRMAYNLANNHKVVIMVNELQEKAISKSVATVLERKQTLTEIMRGRFNQFMDEDGHIDITGDSLRNAALQEVNETTTIIGNRDDSPLEKTVTKIKLRDPIAAIQELNKMEKVYIDGTQALNQTIQILVTGKDGEELTNRILSGERLNKQITEGEKLQ